MASLAASGSAARPVRPLPIDMIKASAQPSNPVRPLLVQVSKAPAFIGMSKSGIYRAAKAGDIKLKNIGRSSFVVMESVHQYIASLPDADIKGEC